MEIRRVLIGLGVGLLVLFPQVPQATFAQTQGLVGDARLGAEMGVVAELTDQPNVLQSAKAQAFVDDVTLKAERVLTDPNEQLMVRHDRRLLVADANYDHSEALQSWEKIQTLVLRQLGPGSKRAYSFILGSMAKQVSYNATVYRNASSDAKFRQAITKLSVLDGAIPHMHTLRMALGEAQPGDWTTIHALAKAIVEAIVQDKTSN